MSDVIGAVLFLLAIVLPAAGVLWIVDRLRRRKVTPEQAARREAELMNALLSPDWEALARAFGRPMPDSLRALYGDRVAVTASDFLVIDPAATTQPHEWEIGDFAELTADPDVRDWVGAPKGSLCFAATRTGDPYFVILGDDPTTDGPVYLYYHDGGDRTLVAERLSDFLRWPRRPLNAETS